MTGNAEKINKLTLYVLKSTLAQWKQCGQGADMHLGKPCRSLQKLEISKQA